MSMKPVGCIKPWLSAVTGQGVGLGSEVHGIDVIEDDFSLETLGVFAHPLHQRRADQSFFTWVISLRLISRERSVISSMLLIPMTSRLGPAARRPSRSPPRCRTSTATGRR